MLPVMEIVLPTVSSNVPAFLAKLWKMVDDPETTHLISWSDEGNSFIIHNQADFAQKLLPYYYKHSNMASFVRQLNMYGFHKVLGIESGGLKSERADQMEFAHPFFIKGQGHLLDQIKRKISAAKASFHSSFSTTSNAASNVSNAASNVSSHPANALKTEHVTEVLNEVHQIKDKQDDIDNKLDSMKKENEALWREVVNLRQKHQSQQKIVNKLIQFLVSLVQPRMTSNPGGATGCSGTTQTAVKRRYNLPLAIEGGEPKEPKLDLQGPTIRDVTYGESIQSPIIETPYSPMQAVDPSLVNPAIHVPFKTKDESSSRPKLHREISREDIDLDMSMMQKDLDNLKDVLSGQVTLDTSIISNIFNPDEPSYFAITPNSSTTTTAATMTSSSSSLSPPPPPQQQHQPLSSMSASILSPPSPSSSLSIDDFIKSINNSSPTKQAKLQLECEPNLFEIGSRKKNDGVDVDVDNDDNDDNVDDDDDDDDEVKKSLLKIRTADDMSSELNTPAIYENEDCNPLLAEFDNKE